jgi:hypothetical protein
MPASAILAGLGRARRRMQATRSAMKRRVRTVAIRRARGFFVVMSGGSVLQLSVTTILTASVDFIIKLSRAG